MFTAQQAREAQQAQEAIQAAMATEEARKKEAEELIAAEALSAKNIKDGDNIFEKAQVAIRKAAVDGEAEAVVYCGRFDDGAFAIACDKLKLLGFTASQVKENVEVPMYDPDMQGMNDYMRATGELKVSWAA